MDDPITKRIEREAGVPDLVEILADRLPPTDLQSLLLAVFRRRSLALTPKDVLDRYERSRFPRPADIEPALLADFDRLAFSLLPEGFEVMEVAPVEPLGTVAVMAGLSQDMVLTTIRNSEVVSDSTNLLALECALRRRTATRRGDLAGPPVKLCASHRVVRGQLYDDPGLAAHFRLLGLVTAGHAEGSYEMEFASLTEQLDFYVRLLKEAARLGIEVDGMEISITDLTDGRWGPQLETAVMEPLSERFTDVHVRLAPEREAGRGYYERACFKVHARDAGGNRVEILDGGFTDWTQALMSNRKERLLISGLGSERVCAMFRPEPGKKMG